MNCRPLFAPTKPCPVWVSFWLMLLATNARILAQERSPLREVLIDSPAVESVFLKVLTPNDDSGRHGVLVPTAAWSFLPSFTADLSSKQNATQSLTTVWRRDGQIHAEPTNWKHYGRYPERRLTGLGSKRLDAKPPLSVLLMAQYRDRSRGYEVHVLYPNDATYGRVLNWFGVEPKHVRPGAFSIVRSIDQPVGHSPALTAFLLKFDRIKSRGYVKTLRAGSTGIGYTLETLLGLAENNDPTGDFLGMELKAYRDRDAALDDSEKMNLFLKEPNWTDGLTSAQRIARYGYVDDNGRTALYSTVTTTQNSHGFRFEIDRPGARLFLRFKDQRIAVWSFATLARRLKEKHTETAFVAARSRGKGAREEFHYHSVTWCARPSVAALIQLVESRDVMLELRMHVKENGSARNHGTAFRVHKNKLRDLYGTTIRCR